MTRQRPEMTEIEAVGYEAAMVAIDQADACGGIENALDDYFDNLGSTLKEIGAWERGAEARRGFEMALECKGVSHRPMGL